MYIFPFFVTHSQLTEPDDSIHLNRGVPRCILISSSYVLCLYFQNGVETKKPATANGTVSMEAWTVFFFYQQYNPSLPWPNKPACVIIHVFCSRSFFFYHVLVFCTLFCSVTTHITFSMSALFSNKFFSSWIVRSGIEFSSWAYFICNKALSILIGLWITWDPPWESSGPLFWGSDLWCKPLCWVPSRGLWSHPFFG